MPVIDDPLRVPARTGTIYPEPFKQGFDGPPPAGRWADLAVLAPVRDYKSRHTSTLLVFDAVEKALAEIESKQAGPKKATASG